MVSEHSRAVAAEARTELFVEEQSEEEGVRTHTGGYAPANVVANETFDLAETRLLLRAQRGEGDALRLLWEPHSTLLWSITEPMLGHVDAVDALRHLRTALRGRARGLAKTRPFRDQALETLFPILRDRLQLQDVAGIVPSELPAPASGTPKAGASQRVQAALRAAPPEIRVVYLFTFLGQLPSSDVARISGWTEAGVRRARAYMAYRLMEASHGA